MLQVGCPAHTLHSAMQTAADGLSCDIESVVKVFSYSSLYTVCVASLKEFSEFVAVAHQDLLGHQATRWLTLFPALEKFTHTFQALKSYFLSLERCPSLLKQFFSDSVGEMHLLFLQAQTNPFRRALSSIERESIAVNEIRWEIEHVLQIVEERKRCAFVTSQVKA